MKLLSVSSSRADVGILGPVWRAACEDSSIDLHVALTGMHCGSETDPAGFVPGGARYRVGGRDLGGADAASASRAMAEIGNFCADVLNDVEPDMLLVIGDRLDMLPAATAAVPFNTPLVHLHGGEITEGAVDDRIRHALTKLAHGHCVSCDSAERNLIAMGEQPSRIVKTGAPGLDTLLQAPQIDHATFIKRLNLSLDAPFRLVTVHPETNSRDPAEPARAVLSALETLPGSNLFTAPNSDPGGEQVTALVRSFVDRHNGSAYVDTLGSQLYPAALRLASMMIGNSSSGIVEAGLFGLPVVNVGDRQKGRERGPNVTDVPSAGDAVAAAVSSIDQTARRFDRRSPYGDGQSGPRIVHAIRTFAGQPDILNKTLAGNS